MMRKVFKIIKEAIPIIIMIWLIPFVVNDVSLTLFYLIIIFIAFVVKRQKNDFIIFTFGFVALSISEYFFIKTGVETFSRQSFLGVMPLWLPILWGYTFVAINRSIIILKS